MTTYDAIARGEAVALAVTAARDFVNDPPNELTPARLAESAQKLAAEQGIDVAPAVLQPVRDLLAANGPDR